MAIDPKKSFKKYTERASRILKDNDRVQKLMTLTNEYMKSVLKNNDQLKDFSNKVYTLVRMLKAQVTGKYTVIPWKSLLMLVASLLYFVSPMDFLPDLIPILGLTDDIAIIVWVYNSILEDIELFRIWENTIDLQPIHESESA